MTNPYLVDADTLRAIVHYAADGIVLLDEDMRVLFLNQAAERLTGWRLDEVAGVHCSAACGCTTQDGRPLTPEECAGHLALSQMENRPWSELKFRSKLGASLDVSASHAVIPSLAGEPRRLILVVRDISERVAMEQELKALQRRLLDTTARQKRQADLLFHIGQDVVSVLDLDRNLQRLTEEIRQLLRTDLAVLMLMNQEQPELYMKAWSGNLSDEVRTLRLPPSNGIVWRTAATGQPMRTGNFPEDVEGPAQTHPLMSLERLRSALGVPLRAHGGTLGVLIVANRRPHHFGDEDLQLLTTVGQALSLGLENQRLYQQVQRAAQEAERQRVAAEIHDGLTQNLFSLQLLLTNLESDLAEGRADSPENRRAIAGAQRILDESIAGTRRLIAELRGGSGADEPRGANLEAAVSDYLRYFTYDSGIHASLVGPGPGSLRLGREASVQLLRIIQEALANVRKHANASAVEVAVEPAEGGITVTITDNGRGFEPGAPGERHFGLQIMEERAAALGGHLTVQSRPGQGTVVTVRLPAGQVS